MKIEDLIDSFNELKNKGIKSIDFVSNTDLSPYNRVVDTALRRDSDGNQSTLLINITSDKHLSLSRLRTVIGVLSNK
jgi:capsule polysaccharide export protein KpsC/LpsZ